MWGLTGALHGSLQLLVLELSSLGKKAAGLVLINCFTELGVI